MIKTNLFKTVWLALILAFTLTLFMPAITPVMASNTSQASYIATIRITNNGSIAYNVSVPLTLNTSSWINSAFFTSNLSNTSIQDNFGNDTAYNPAVVANTTWMIFVPVIPANSSIDYALYTGGNLNMNGGKYLFPGTTGMITGDYNSMELASDFSVNITAWIDTTDGVSKNLVSKGTAFNLAINGTGNITASLSGNTTTVQNVASGLHTIEVSYSGFRLSVKVDNPLTTNSDINQDYSIDDTDLAILLSKYGAVNTGDILSVRSDLNNNGVVNVADYGIFSNQYGHLKSNAYSSGMANTTTPWIFYQNDVVSYVSSHKIYASGELRQSIEWQNSGNWTDSSGFGNYALPTFRTTTTNANVSAVIVDFQTDHEAILTDWDLNAYNGTAGVPDMPSGMYSPTNPVFPGAGIITDIETGGDVPPGLLWFILPTVLILGISLMIHDKTKSLALQAGVILLCVLLISLIHIWPLWVIVPMVIQMGACAFSSKVYGY
jgi:hypothetical protein